MKDLDFDELDKAVNSLMGGVKEKDASDTAKTLDINTTLGPDETPTYGTLSQVAGKIGSEAIDRQEQTVSLEEESSLVAPTTQTAVASSAPDTPKQRQKPGRFMDVVHPSSDMKRSTPAKVSREGTTISAPERPVATPEPTEQEPVSAAPEDATQPKEVTPETTAGSLPVSAAPDHDTSEGTDAKVPKEAAVEPLSSPFLADAKVEKRPLGGEPPTGSPAPIWETKDEGQKPIEPLLPEPETPAPNKPDESSVMDALTNPVKTEDELTMHVPEEFQNELLAVEKGSSEMAHETDPQPDISPAVEPLAVASIPKQYQEKSSSNDTAPGAIFDTDQYHKPLAHPPKKKSGWLWVVAIIVIILLGAGAGAFAYFVGV